MALNGTGNPYNEGNDAARLEARLTAFEMRKKGRSLRDIGAALSVSHTTVAKWVKECIDEQLTPVVEEYRTQMLAELDDMIAKTWETLQTDTPVMQHGKIVRDDNGNPIIDKDFTLKVMTTLTRLLDQRAKLTGAYAPTEHKVETSTVVDSAIQNLVDEMNQVNNAKLETIKNKQSE